MMPSFATYCASDDDEDDDDDDNYSDSGFNSRRGKKHPPDDECHIGCLPEDVLQNVVLHLSVTDVLSLISVNQRLRIGLGRSANLWDVLSDRDGSSCYEEGHTKSFRYRRSHKRGSGNDENQNSEEGEEEEEEYSDWSAKKSSYLLERHISNPSKSGGGVRWYPVRPYGPCVGISEREGHVSCVLSRHALSHLAPSTSAISAAEGTPQERIVVVTGGFCNDDSLYFINAGTGIAIDTTDVSVPRHHHWEMKRADAMGRGPSFVYGATLTALPTLYSETSEGEGSQRLTANMRAIRFGGFRAGGYSNETSSVFMLTVKQGASKVRKRRGKREREHINEGGDDGYEGHWSAGEWYWNQPWEIEWSAIATTGIEAGDNDEEGSPERDFLSRAYHTATLLLDRYLLIVGGMKSNGSVINEAILDTKTWTWVGNGDMTCGRDSIDSRPSGRHGHSMVFDDSRNRLLLFGGGSGSDLLRSGEDNSEVWELRLGEGWRDAENLSESFPWKWKKLHEDSHVSHGDRNGDERNTGMVEINELKLTPSESLCLGRCHNGVKISRDTVLLLFGSGRPSTNGLLAYDLKADDFYRHHASPQNLSSLPATSSNFCSAGGAVHVKGILPKPRFTAIAIFLEQDGYIITHGGFCSQDRDTIGMLDVLDLAPGLRGQFGGLAIDDRRVTYEEVTDSQAVEGRRDAQYTLHRMILTLLNTPPGERQAAAGFMLDEMRRGALPLDGESLILMTTIASGSHPFTRN